MNDILKVEEGTDFDSRASAKTEETNIGTVVIHKEAEGQNQVLKMF